MNEKIEAYLDIFKQYGEVSIADEEWTTTFEKVFRERLKIEGIDEIRIYQTIVQADRKLICRVFHQPSMKILQEYPARTAFIRWLPLLCIVLCYFLIISLIALSSEKMLTVAFLLFLPFSLGAIMEYVKSLKSPNSLKQTFLQQIYILFGIIVVGVVILREGGICLIMAAPIFFLCSTLGATCMHFLCRRLWKPYNKVYSIVLLPLLGLLLLPDFSQYHNGLTRQEIIVNAPIQDVFASINNIQQIQSSEIKFSPIFLMGFPKPISGMTEQTDNGLIRQIYWQRGIHFQEKITQSHAPTQLAWTYVFNQESFPKGSLDDHLKIGGAYFNLLTTDYQLEAISPQQTKMVLTIDYRLSTEVNWYADLWTRYVLNEFSDVVLNIYKHRLEKQS